MHCVMAITSLVPHLDSFNDDGDSSPPDASWAPNPGVIGYYLIPHCPSMSIHPQKIP